MKIFVVAAMGADRIEKLSPDPEGSSMPEDVRTGAD
jgi:hypothetical protein